LKRYSQALRLAISDDTLRNANWLDDNQRSLGFLRAPWFAGNRARWGGEDERTWIRALCETYDESDEVAVEFGAFYAATEGPDALRNREEVLKRLGHQYGLQAPVVILTEGSSDQEMLAAATKVVYPKLTEYLRFLDHSPRNKPEQNAAGLVRAVKSFAAAGIGNRIIAIFDNDGAGRRELRSLDVDTLPANFRILHYPDTELARCYPAFNEYGAIEPFDVNGRAASIELYLGQDVLQVDGFYVPVEWKGSAGSQAYAHGVVQKKKMLQERYRAKATAVLNGSIEFNERNWTEMTAILDSLRSAFDD
jgi:hypothetical protein